MPPGRGQHCDATNTVLLRYGNWLCGVFFVCALHSVIPVVGVRHWSTSTGGIRPDLESILSRSVCCYKSAAHEPLKPWCCWLGGVGRAKGNCSGRRTRNRPQKSCFARRTTAFDGDSRSGPGRGETAWPPGGIASLCLNDPATVICGSSDSRLSWSGKA